MRRSVVLGAGLSALTAFPAAAGRPAPPGTLPGTLIIAPDRVVTGAVNGQPARFRMQANGTSTLVLNPDAAARLGLRGGWIKVGAKVGPVLVRGQTAVTRYAVVGHDQRKRVGWFERPTAPGFDGDLGPASVPHPVVVFQLRPPVAGERPVVLPLADMGLRGLGTSLTIGGQTIFVTWALDRRDSVATAAAGAVLAPPLGGQFVGAPGRATFAFGVERPVRRLRLDHPLALGPLRLDAVQVRTADYGNVSAIPVADSDPGEIVVTGSRKSGKALYALQIGTEAMAGCSSLVFDKPRRQIILHCR